MMTIDSATALHVLIGMASHVAEEMAAFEDAAGVTDEMAQAIRGFYDQVQGLDIAHMEAFRQDAPASGALDFEGGD